MQSDQDMQEQFWAKFISICNFFLSISFRMKNKTRTPTHTTFIQCSVGSPSQSNQTRIRNIRNSNWKGRSKTLTISDEIILCIENTEDTIRKY